MKDRYGNKLIIKYSVWDCENFKPFREVLGGCCEGCGMRNGYLYFGQPSKNCLNFKLKKLLKEL